MLKAAVNPVYSHCPEKLFVGGALLLLLTAFAGCSKPLLHTEGQSLAQSEKIESRAIMSGSRGYSENMAADTVIITRFDTVSRETVVAKYYGIKSVKVDTLRQVELVEVKKTDTLTVEKIVNEKNEVGIMQKLRIMLLGVLFAGILFGVWKIYRRIAE